MEAPQPLKGRFMTAEFKRCRSENGELKEKYIPAFGVCAALWGQQLKRFGELHHLKAKEDVVKALGVIHGKGRREKNGGGAPARQHLSTGSAESREDSKAEIMSAFNALLLLLSKTGGSGHQFSLMK